MSVRTHTALRSSAVLVALAVAALVMIGCGGDEDEAADTTSTTESANTETTESDAGDSTADTAEDSTDGEGSGSFTSEDCEQLAEAFEQFDVSESLDGSTDPTPQLEEVAGQLAAAADDAPDAVAGDLRVLADVYEELAAASGDVDWEGLQSGNPAAAAGAARLGEIYASNPDFLTAAENLTTWITENCTPVP